MSEFVAVVVSLGALPTLIWGGLLGGLANRFRLETRDLVPERRKKERSSGGLDGRRFGGFVAGGDNRPCSASTASAGCVNPDARCSGRCISEPVDGQAYQMTICRKAEVCH